MGTKCECGHEKRDHGLPLLGTQAYGRCKVCLCDRYVKPDARALAVAVKAAGQP
ncbi:MAG TPA: hypothetical protein VE994_14660 [Terriglobales bacterium]|nr:hypothetical protein [Terriglobales bacterium]